MSMDLLNAVDKTTEKTLRSFLEKPVSLDSGLLSSTDVSTTFTPSAIIQALLNSSIYSNKVQGFLGFRANIELTLVVNAQRFQQGRYMLYYVPTCGSGMQGGVNRIVGWLNMHEANLTTRTQLPHVELDVNCDTKATLHIPYVSALSCYPLGAINNTLDIGFYRISPYEPMNAGSCTYTLWGRFTDIEFVGAALPQSGRIRYKSKTVQEQERDDGDVGPVSGLLRKVSTASDELGKIPLLTSFTQPVAFMTEILANAAAIFGWSKPNVLNPQHVILKDRMRYATNYDGATTAMPLSLSCKNEVQTVPFAGTEHDEMSFDYIKSIPAFYARYEWSTATAKESLIGSFALSGGMSVSHNYGGASATTFLPCGLASNFFSMYRGSLTVTIKAVKTEFHSGRYMISFIPNGGYDTTAGVNNFNNTDFLHRAIVDVREGNQWVFNIPYSSSVQWRSLGDTNYSYGTVQLHVVDPLVAPTSVASSIVFLIEISGGEDLEYAQPIGSTLAPATVATIQAGNMESCLKYVDTLGNNTPSTASLAPAALCIGEKFTSYRQLLKRVSMLAPTINYPPANYMTVIPYANEVSYITAASVVTASVAADNFSVLASMFGLARGSVRMSLYNTNDPDNIFKGTLTYVQPLAFGSAIPRMITTGTTDNYSSGGARRLNGHLLAMNENDSNLVISNVQVPSYVSNGSFACADLIMSEALAIGFTYPTVNSTAPRYVLNSTFLAQGGGAAHSMPTAARAGADDMSFGMFISTVPMYDIGPSVINNWSS